MHEMKDLTRPVKFFFLARTLDADLARENQGVRFKWMGVFIQPAMGRACDGTHGIALGQQSLLKLRAVHGGLGFSAAVRPRSQP